MQGVEENEPTPDVTPDLKTENDALIEESFLAECSSQIPKILIKTKSSSLLETFTDLGKK